jgi:UDP-N-acetylmuramoyl-L-alanyl-D-glutamate--2,6-diaminopimelate ligase
LFVAICGDDFDGHDFVYEAIQRGAVAVVAERMLPIQVPLCLVSDTREAYGRICQALVDHPTREMTTIGVTGTHGKTTVAKLLASVLRAAGGRVGTINSLESCDGIVSHDGQRPSGSPELAHWMAEMQAAGCTHAVIEVDSRDLAQRRSAGLEFDAAVLTNLRPEGAHQHNTPKNYRRATDRIFAQLKEGGFAVVNADDRGSQRVLARLECPALTAALHADAEIGATIVERSASEQTVLLTAGDEMIPLRTHIIGDHHVSNCLLVAAAALALGVDLPTIVRGLEAVETLPLRMERIECGQPFGVFLDAANSPDRLAMCLKTLRQVTTGRVICVANADGTSRLEERPLIGRVLEKHAGIGLITTTGHGSGPALQSIHDVIDGYDRPARAHAMPDREQAIAWALSQAEPGDCVLIAGCDKRAKKTDADQVRNLLLDDAKEDIEQLIMRIHQR